MIISIVIYIIHKDGQCQNGFKGVQNTSEFNKHFIKNCNEDNDKGYFLEVDVQYTKKLRDFHYETSFLPERMKIEKVEKLVTDLHHKEKGVILKTNLTTITK